MKLKTIKKTARNWQHELRDQVRGDESHGHTALLAWEVVGGLAVLFGIYAVINMWPEMVRYLKIERM